MIYDIIPLFIIIGAVIVIIVILLRKIPKVAKEESILKKGEKKKMEFSSRFVKVKNILVKVGLYLKTSLLKFMGWVINWTRRRREILRQKLKEKGLKRELQTPLDKPFELEKNKEVLELIKKAKDLVEQNKFPEAEKVYIEIVSKDPHNIEVYKNLGNLYLKQENFRDAAESFKQVIKLGKKDAEVFSKLGLVMYNLKKYNDAAGYYKDAIRFDKNKASQYIDLGLAYAALGEYKKALKNYEKAVKLDHTNIKYMNYVIDTALKINDKITARLTLNKIMALEPSNEKAKKKLDELDKNG